MNAYNLFNREKIVTTAIPRDVNDLLMQNDIFLLKSFFNDKTTTAITMQDKN